MNQRIAFGYPRINLENRMAIVGVVDDVKYTSMAETPGPTVYLPRSQHPYWRQTMAVASSLTDPVSLAPTIRGFLKELDPQLPVEFATLSSIVSASLGRQRLGMMLMLVFAGCAVVLAAVGIYGVVAYATEQRHNEAATRMALGATPRHVFWLVMNQGRTLFLIGAALGVPLAYALGRLAVNRLYEVRASDPLVLVVAVGLVLLITAGAVVLPARRAAQVTPGRLLR